MMMEELYVVMLRLPWFKVVTPQGYIKHLGENAFEITGEKREASWFSGPKSVEIANLTAAPAGGVKH